MRPKNDAKGSTRQRIIEAALEKFREKGIDGTCLAEVMDAAAVKRESFYYHFKSKEQLVLEVFVFALKQAFDSWKSAVAEDRSAFGGDLIRYISIPHLNHSAVGDSFAP